MNSQRLTKPVGPLARVGGPPLKPEPFDMAQWRREWAAWWSRANREAIRAVIPGKR